MRMLRTILSVAARVVAYPAIALGALLAMAGAALLEAVEDMESRQ
jgi:hypothetical protein